MRKTMRSANPGRGCLLGLLAAGIVVLFLSSSTHAADCPQTPAMHIPLPPPPPLNIDLVKKALINYHNEHYLEDMASAYTVARDYVLARSDRLKKPAIVLDIDETSLSNWDNIEADDFGFIEKGSCSLRPKFACGFDSWIAKGTAPAFTAALDFYNTVHGKHIAVFFITGRTDDQRDTTIKNLHRAGFRDWTGLVTRSRQDKKHNKSIIPFKSAERAKIEENGYTIVATIGDQDSDLAGGHAECAFKLPNPFYFIP